MSSIARYSFGLAASALLLCSTAATPARACSFPDTPDPQFFQASAVAGGTWWLQAFDAGPTVHLTGLDGVADIDVAVVSSGAGGSVALAVPDDVVPGARWLAPEGVTGVESWNESVVDVIAGDLDDAIGDLAIPSPALRIDIRETRSGYTDVAVSPFGGECSQATGWWNHTYREGAYAVIDAIPDGYVLDMTVRFAGDDAFAPVSMANEILYDGDVIAAVDELVPGLPDDEGRFSVNARLRRIADGATGDVVSVDVTLDPTETSRTEFVGCAAQPAAPLSLFALALLMLRGKSRRRTTM